MAAVSTAVAPIRWTSAAAVAFWRLWQWKFFGSVVFSALFFAGYFSLLKHPVYPVTTMPVVALDRAIPFQPQAFWIYVSLWIYLQIAPCLLLTKTEIWTYGAALLLMVLIAFFIFFFWPTQVPNFALDWSEHPGFAWLKQTDASGNACPSLHVAFAIFSARWVHFILQRMQAGRLLLALNWIWSLAIVYSTIATRQHVTLDVFAGAVLGASMVSLHFSWLRALPPER